jgi:hypothetical protein
MESSVKLGVDPDVGEYQINLDHHDSFNLETQLEGDDMNEMEMVKPLSFHPREQEIDEIYEHEEYGYEMGEEEEANFRKSGFSGNYDLEIIHENADDEIEGSGSKHGSPP